jgi:hypothetical protein
MHSCAELHSRVELALLTMYSTGLQPFRPRDKWKRVTTVRSTDARRVSKSKARKHFTEFRAYRQSQTRGREEELQSDEQRLDDFGNILNTALGENSPSDTLIFLQVTRFFDQQRELTLRDAAPEFRDMFDLTETAPAVRLTLVDLTLLPPPHDCLLPSAI